MTLAGLFLCAFLGGCSEDDEDRFAPLTDPAILPVAQCTALHVNALARLIERMQNLFDLLNGAPLPPGIVENTPLANYTLSLDLERDGTPDISVDLVVSGGSDISDGIQAGESLQATLTFSDDISGNGNVAFGPLPTLPGLLNLNGPINLTDGGTCSFATFFFNASWTAGDLDTVEPNFQFSTSEGAMTLNASLFTDGDSDFLIVFGQLDGVDVGFAIDTVSFNVFDD